VVVASVHCYVNTSLAF